MRQHVPHEVDATALPSRAENLGDSGLEAFVGIGDDELDAAQATPGELAQELGPDRRAFRSLRDVPRSIGSNERSSSVTRQLSDASKGCVVVQRGNRELPT
jgi:hypothetical protein